eukprot:EC096600.1.p3 GENE.EC096600.1~~EC096600.1.p3  ORF type:complete len:133 (+),score=4.52 EC096600.1:300-698(+)
MRQPKRIQKLFQSLQTILKQMGKLTAVFIAKIAALIQSLILKVFCLQKTQDLVVKLSYIWTFQNVLTKSSNSKTNKIRAKTITIYFLILYKSFNTVPQNNKVNRDSQKRTSYIHSNVTTIKNQLKLTSCRIL